MSQTRYDETVENSMRMFYGSLGERERRHYAAIEAVKLGHGGITYISDVLSCSERTVRRGLDELGQSSHHLPGMSRKKGGAANAVSIR